MKKVSILFIVLIVLSSINVLAEVNPDIVENDDFRYYVYNDEVIIVGLSISGMKNLGDNDRHLVIPETIEGFPVKHIGDYAFKDQSIKSADFPEGLETIRYEAFCMNDLTELNFSKNLKRISPGAFMHNNIEKISIGPNVSIEYDSINQSFYDTYNLYKKLLNSLFKGCFLVVF